MPQPQRFVCSNHMKAQQLNTTSAAADENTLLVSSQWRSSTAVLAITLDSGKVQRISQHDSDKSCWSFAAACQGKLHHPHPCQQRHLPAWQPQAHQAVLLLLLFPGCCCRKCIADLSRTLETMFAMI